MGQISKSVMRREMKMQFNNPFTRVWLRYIITLVMALMLSSCSDPVADSQKMLDKAKSYLSENSPREAALELKNALQANPENGEARYLLGLLNLDFGDTAGAEKEFRRAQESGWSEEESQIGLAKAAVNGNDFKKMAEEIEIKEQYSATARANLYGLKASAMAGLGLRAQAEEAFVAGKTLDAEAVQIRKVAVQLKLLDADSQGARADASAALSAYPDDRELLLLSGIAALKEQDMAGGTEAYQRVIELEPSNITTIYGRQARIRLARLQIVDKQIEDAAETLKPLFRQYGNDPETNFLGGMLAFVKGNHDLAEERLLKVLKVMSDHPQTLLLFGTVKYQQKDFEQAAHYLSRYLSGVPDNLGARKLLGRTYMQLGQDEKAQETLKSALNAGADDVELLALVGLNDVHTGDLASGIASLQKAAASAPENTALRKELALAYIKSGDAELAIDELQGILAKTDEKGNTQTLLVLAHLKAGQPNKAIDAALKVLSENPDNPAALTLVGSVYAATGDNAEARNYYQKALEISPGNPNATLSLAQLEEAEGNISTAVSMHQSLVDSGVESIAPMLALARLAEKQGDRKSLVSWLERARSEAPGQLQPRIVLAEAYLRDKDLPKAEAVVKESRDIDSENSLVRGQWARLLMDNKRYNEARDVLQDLVQAEPDSIFARLLLAETYLNLNSTEEARQELEIALKKDPKSVGGLILLGRTELMQGRFAEVDNITAKLLELNPGFHRAYMLSGDSWLGRKDLAKALAAYRKAWEKQQNSGLAVKLATTAARTGKLEEGVEVLRTWLESHAEDVRALQLLGSLLQTNGRKDEAVKIYEKLLELHSDNLVALNNLAVIYSQENNPRALALAKKAYQIAPDNAGVKDTYGWILVQDGKLDEGRSLLKEAFEALPDVSEVHYHYAAALIMSGEESKGEDLLRSLLSKDAQFEGRVEAEKLLSK